MYMRGFLIQNRKYKHARFSKIEIFVKLVQLSLKKLRSRIIVTGSPRLRCISFIHLLGKDNMYVDLPVNCILRTSFSLDTVLNMDLGICFNKHIMKMNHIAVYTI